MAKRNKQFTKKYVKVTLKCMKREMEIKMILAPFPTYQNGKNFKV